VLGIGGGGGCGPHTRTQVKTLSISVQSVQLASRPIVVSGAVASGKWHIHLSWPGVVGCDCEMQFREGRGGACNLTILAPFK